MLHYNICETRCKTGAEIILVSLNFNVFSLGLPGLQPSKIFFTTTLLVHEVVELVQ